MSAERTTQMENPHLAHYARLVAEQRDEIQKLREALLVIADGDGDAQVIARQTLEAARMRSV